MSFKTQQMVWLGVVTEPMLVDGSTGGVGGMVDGRSGVGLPGVLLPGVVTVGFVPGGGEGVLVVFTVVGGVVRGVVDSVEEGEVD